MRDIDKQARKNAFLYCTFRDKQFALYDAFAKEKGMVGIKGHRSVGGFRASCYNALPKESVEALVACMQEFARKHGK
mgnify:CR=1 FL=1